MSGFSIVRKTGRKGRNRKLFTGIWPNAHVITDPSEQMVTGFADIRGVAATRKFIDVRS